jgi:hypothetical protein
MSSDRPIEGSDIAPEFAGASFGDARLSARVVQIAERCAESPGASLPTAMRAESELTAAYRFLSNEAVRPGAMLSPHFQRTAERMTGAECVLVAHDTTEFKFSTDREGFGYLRAESERGFLMHASLAVSADGKRTPLGLCGFHTWIRSGEPRRKKAAAAAEPAGEAEPEKENESERWARQVESVGALLDGRVGVIHVMDREADAYPLLAGMLLAQRRFIVRSRIDRIVRSEDEGDTTKLHDVLHGADDEIEMEVPLSPRVKKRPSATPARQARRATLRVRATSLSLRKPPYVKDAEMWADVNVVHVREVDAPADAVPVEWTLLTSEPVGSLRDILFVIESYRARWLIEEFFKALKTGCEYEKLQLETLHALQNALAMFCPIAWRMLHLRSLARDQPDAPADTVLTKTEVAVLRAVGSMKLPATPTVADALLAVAMMGGYQKHKVPPGWLTLARGFETLSMIAAGWEARERAS